MDRHTISLSPEWPLNFNCEIFIAPSIRAHISSTSAATWYNVRSFVHDQCRHCRCRAYSKRVQSLCISRECVCVFEPRYVTHCSYESIAHYQPHFVFGSVGRECVRMNAILFINFMCHMHTSWVSGCSKSVCHSSNVNCNFLHLSWRVYTQWHAANTRCENDECAAIVAGLLHVQNACIRLEPRLTAIFNGANWIYIYWICCRFTLSAKRLLLLLLLCVAATTIYLSIELWMTRRCISRAVPCLYTSYVKSYCVTHNFVFLFSFALSVNSKSIAMKIALHSVQWNWRKKERREVVHRRRRRGKRNR